MFCLFSIMFYPFIPVAITCRLTSAIKKHFYWNVYLQCENTCCNCFLSLFLYEIKYFVDDRSIFMNQTNFLFGISILLKCLSENWCHIQLRQYQLWQWKLKIVNIINMHSLILSQNKIVSSMQITTCYSTILSIQTKFCYFVSL